MCSPGAKVLRHIVPKPRTGRKAGAAGRPKASAVCGPAATKRRDRMVEMGPQRLLWGSDWPCTNHEALADYAALRQALDVWLGDAAAARAALVTNPERLYWLQGSPE